MTEPNFTGETVLVTGGTRGIGREMVRQLVSQGAKVIAVGRDQAGLDALAAAHKERVFTLQADLTDREDVNRLADRVINDHPDLTMLINNAGLQVEMDLFKDPASALLANAQREIALNLEAPIALTTHLLPILSAQPKARIVNIGTGLAIAPKEAAPVYCATKAGLRSFSKTLRYQCETIAANIRVTEAIMALVETDMTAGRGSGKMSAHDAAAQVLDGAARNQSEIWVGKAKLLRAIHRISPALAHRILR